MRNYWLKILLGAVAIFAVGMIVVRLARSATHKVREVATTADPITIPFPGSFVPFNLDGRRVGSLKEMTIYRSAPKVPDHIDLEVALADSIAPSRIAGCILVAEQLKNIDEHTSFTCMTAKDTAGRDLVKFGSIDIRGSDAEPRVVLAPRAEMERMRRDFTEDRAEHTRDSVDARADRTADSIETEANRIADSVEAVAESSRGQVEAQIEAQRAVAESIRNVAREKAEQARAR
jgi:hypothetical protein